jgi:hypothetical protein
MQVLKYIISKKHWVPVPVITKNKSTEKMLKITTP